MRERGKKLPRLFCPHIGTACAEGQTGEVMSLHVNEAEFVKVTFVYHLLENSVFSVKILYTRLIHRVFQEGMIQSVQL